MIQKPLVTIFSPLVLVISFLYISSFPLQAQDDLKVEYFFKAIETENYEKIERYLASGISIDQEAIKHKEYNGDRFIGRKSRTPLLRAIELQKPELIAYLISKGADVNKSLEVSWYEICDDCKYDAYYRKPQFKQSKAYTPLGWAIAWGNIEIIELLVSEGAEYQKEIAAIKQSGNIEVWDYFIGKGVELDFTPDDLEYVYKNYFRFGMKPTERLFESGIIANGATLFQMVELKDTAILRIAINNGADINSFKKDKALSICPICKAVLMCDVEMVKLLVESYNARTNVMCSFYSGGNTNLSTVTPMQIARSTFLGKCKGRNEELIEYLLWAE